MIKVYAEIDLTDAITIELDKLNDDGTAVLYVAFSSGNKEFKISYKQLQDMVAASSFKWGLGDNYKPTKLVVEGI